LFNEMAAFFRSFHSGHSVLQQKKHFAAPEVDLGLAVGVDFPFRPPLIHGLLEELKHNSLGTGGPIHFTGWSR
jgi:hypothetical protein